MTVGPGYAPVTASDEWFKGEDQDLEWTIFTRETRIETDISGWVIEFRLAATEGGVSVLTKSAGLTQPFAGVTTVEISASDTSGFVADTYWYQLSRTDSGSNTVLAYGPAALLARNG